MEQPVTPSHARSVRSADTTAALLQACRSGDAGAWEQLIRTYQRLIYAIPRRAGLSDDGAAEVFQRVWVSLFEHLDRIEHPERLTTWLATTARRESWRMLRAERATSARSVGAAEELDELEDSALLPDALIERMERQQLVRECLAGLDPRCRDLLTFLFYSERPASYAAIAGALGVAEGSIGPRRARCLQRLQRLIEARDG